MRNALVSEQVRMLPALRSSLFLAVLSALPASVLLLSPLPSPALAKTAPPASTTPSLLPTDFAGWSLSAPAQESTAPEAADPANAGVLKEYGFQQFSTAHYANGDNKLTARAIRFQDASGAYGAFTFFGVPAVLRSKSVAAQPGMAATSCSGTARLWLTLPSTTSRP